jgi:hypothetical protein
MSIRPRWPVRWSSSSTVPWPASRRALWALTAAVFVLSAAAFHGVYSRFPILYDADAYYHLAVAREYGKRGIFDTLDWARFSVMHDGFGDKDFLFHVLLIPAAVFPDPTDGAVVVLALLNAAVATLLAYAGMTTIGRWGLAVPLIVFGAAGDFALRMDRLRPEIVSLLLILVAIPLASRGRAKLLGLVACLYALGYTAIHAFLGLCLLFFLQQIWAERRVDWRLIVYPVVGATAGLVLHPHFPANLHVWFVQSIQFFELKDVLDVGPEIQPRTTKDVFVQNLGWWAFLLVVWRCRAVVGAPGRETRLRDLTAVATAVFALLYVLMGRFVTYFVPLATLALLRWMRAAGEAPGPAVRLPWRGEIPAVVALWLCLLSVVPTAYQGYGRMERSSRAFRPEARADWEAFGRAMPDGAKVMAPWGATHHFVFWAPQAFYLNVLDPVFMVAKDPDAHRLSKEVFEGREPDVPLVARMRFDSEFYADDGQYPFARKRVERDPRAEILHDGSTYLYRFVEGRNRDFILDWKVLSADEHMSPVPDAMRAPGTPSYPRAVTEIGRAFEGYVDGRRVAMTTPCLFFEHVEDVPRRTRLSVEVSPYGSAEVFVDDRLEAVISGRGAVIGRGVILPFLLEPGAHRLSIRTCRSEGHIGFYALVRERATEPMQ